MGLVLGISICVGGVVAFKKTRKHRKKKKQKKLAEQEANKVDDSSDEVEDSGCDSGDEEEYTTATVADIHEEVISDRGYSESVRKRKRAWPSNGETDKSKTNRSSSGMTKLHEEWDENEYTAVTTNTNFRSQRGSTQRGSSGSPKSQKTHKNYKHLQLHDSHSEDESESSGVGVNEKSSFGNCAHVEPEWESGDAYCKNEVYHQVAKDMRMSIRVGESGNTIFKIYKTDNSQKKTSSELRSTTEEIPV